MAAGHEVRENDGWLYASGDAVEHSGEATEERWYHNVNRGIRDLCEAGGNESDTAERRTRPGYSKLETRSSSYPDWRDESIVSPFFNTVLINARPIWSPSPLHADSLSAHSTIVLRSISIVLLHSFLLVRATLITFIFSYTPRC